MRATIGLSSALAAAVFSAAPSAHGQDASPPARKAVVLRALLCPRRTELFAGITPLSYRGGFHTKTLVYEPLVRIDAKGELVPCLAESWTQSPDGRTWTFRLRDGVTSHDGARFDAAAVREYMIRLAANPGHRWIGATERIQDVQTPDARTVVVTLAAPWYFAGELATINPWYVVAPGAFDYEGTFVASVGTGPFRLVQEIGATGQVYEANPKWWGGAPAIDRIEAKLVVESWRENHEVLRALLAGEVDLIADGEVPVVPREELERVKAKPRFKIWRRPGSTVQYLLLNTTKGPTTARDVRRRLAAAVDRAALVEKGELGYAQPSTTLFRGGESGWPAQGRAAAPAASSDAVRLRLLLAADSPPRVERHAELLRAQAAGKGIDLVVETARDADEFKTRVESGDWEVQIRNTQGAPYDPWCSLQGMFRKDFAAAQRTASRGRPAWEDETMKGLVLAAETAVGDDARRIALAAVQARLDEEVPLVPLFAFDRVAVSVAELEGLEFGSNGYDLGLAAVRLRRQ